ncbi:MAG: glycosyltransferase [Bacteroidetes bacterium]|nr:glycosyltransferase [Bacteroidota bacterium]
MTESKPKLAVVLSRFPLPLDKGDKLRAFEQMKLFTRFFDVHLFCLSDKKVNQLEKKTLKELGIILNVYQLPKWLSMLNVIFGLFRNLPLQVAYFKNHLISRKMQHDIRKIQPSHIYCQLIRMAEYVKDMHDIPKTLDYMDTFSKGIERRIKNTSFINRWAFKLEYRRLTKYESVIFDYFEHHTIISEQDQKQINHPRNHEILCIPNGVRNDFFNWTGQPTQHDAVFVGNLSYPPNVKAVEFIIEELLPLIRVEKPQYTFAAYGAQPHVNLKKYQQIKGVEINGWVDDIRSAYASGRVFLAPMLIGTGLQNKLLEAMAMGVPCITTPLAGAPISAVHDQHLLLAKEPQDFVLQLLKLDEPNFRETIIKGAKEHVKSNFDWKIVTQPLIDCMFSTKNLL